MQAPQLREYSSTGGEFEFRLRLYGQFTPENINELDEVLQLALRGLKRDYPLVPQPTGDPDAH